MSRFRPDLRALALNEAGELDASSDLAEVVGLALDAREQTGGRFDPTVHDALVAAGYDRTFDELPDGRARRARPARVRRRRRASTAGASRSTPGVRLDLGGIGKGYAAERVADAARARRPVPRQRRRRRRRPRRPGAGTWPVAVADEPHARARPRAGSRPPAATAGAGAAAASSSTT